MQSFLTFFQLAVQPYKYPVLVKKFRTRTVLWYYFLIIFASLAIPALFQLPKLNETRTAITTVITSVASNIPKDAKITIKDGEFTTTIKQPFAVPSDEKSGGVRKNILVIDTTATVDDFDSYETYVLVTKKALAVYSDNQLRVIPFSQMGKEELTITQTDVLKIIGDITVYITKFFNLLVIVIATFGILVGSTLGAFFSVLLTGIIVAIMAWLSLVKLPFNKKLLLSSTLLILMTLIGFIWSIAKIPIKNPLDISWMHTFVYVLWLTPAMMALRKDQKVKKPWKKTWTIIVGILLGLFLLPSLFSNLYR